MTYLLHLQALVFWTNVYGAINTYELLKKTVCFERFCEHNINFVIYLLDKSGKLKSWYVFKMENNLNHTSYFWWLQLTDAISKTWKIVVQNNINCKGVILNFYVKYRKWTYISNIFWKKVDGETSVKCFHLPTLYFSPFLFFIYSFFISLHKL